MKALSVILLILTSLNAFSQLSAKQDSTDYPSIKIGATAFIAYYAQYETKKIDNNRFAVHRAYLTLRSRLNPKMDFRITLDTYDDDDGVEERLKYLFVRYHFGDFLFLRKNALKFGITHTPWLDFEEHIDYYRMQGTMFIERSGIFNSADFGFTMEGFLGGQMDKKYMEEVNPKYSGLYGTYAVGIYNGPGYHNMELNGNKIFQGRMTLRPLPFDFPGFQLSYFYLNGKGNYNEDIDASPDWLINLLMASYENSFLTFTLQGFQGYGDRRGLFAYENGKAWDYGGISFFAEGKIPGGWKIISRCDYFDPNRDLSADHYYRFIFGAGYDFGNRNILLIDYDHKFYHGSTNEDEKFLKATMQIHF